MSDNLELEMMDYLFDLRGYVILRGAIEPDLVVDLNHAFDEFPELEYKAWHGNVQRFDNNGHAGVELQNIVEAGEPFEKLIDNPAWLPLMQRWCGESDSYVHGLFIDECFASIRRSGGYFPVHSGGYRGAARGQYRYANGVFRCGQVNALMALTDVGPGDGGTMVIPGSHKSNFLHPQVNAVDYGRGKQMDDLEGAVEVHLNKGDALLFVDGISHGASARTNEGERRVVIYRYGVSWGSTRHGYAYSPALLERLTPARRKILQPIKPRLPADQGDFMTTTPTLSDAQMQQFERDGFLVVRELLSADEAAHLRAHFMDLHARGPVEGLFAPKTAAESADILKQFPRFMHPHRADKTSFDYMLDGRTQTVLRDLLGEEPLAAQSMFYFKPPGARGQALHQDNFYLRVSPGTCMAAWFALDDADEENGGLFVVPGSHTTGIQCPHVADIAVSFTTEEVDVPPEMQPVAVELKAGDVLFFNGSVIHGSYPNDSKDRFRRAFICHYVGASVTEMAGDYYPLHTFAGETLERGKAQEGGICGSEDWEKIWEARRAQRDWSSIQ